MIAVQAIYLFIDLGPTRSLPVLVVVLASICALLIEKKRLALPKLALVYMAMFVFMMLGEMYTKTPDYGIWKLTVFGIYWIVFTYCVSELCNNINSTRSLLVGLMVGGSVYIGIALATVGLPTELLQDAHKFYRLSFGPDSNPIIFSTFMGVSIIAILWGFKQTKSWIIKVCTLPLVIAGISFMVLSGSKGPVLSLLLAVVASAYLSVWLSNGIPNRIAKLLAGSLFAGVLFFFFRENLPWEFVNSRYTFGQSTSYEHRAQMYDLAWEVGMSSPRTMLIGEGLGSFAFFDGVGDARWYPHNIFLETFAELGFLGVCILTVCLLYPLLLMFRFKLHVKEFARRHGRADLPSLAALYVFSVSVAQTSGDLPSNYWIAFSGVLLYRYVRLASRESRLI